MARSPSQPQQGGSNTQPQQQQQQSDGLPSSKPVGKPVFKDWAAI